MSAPLHPGDVVRLRDLVRERVGLSFPQSRLPNVEWAVRKTLAETGLPDAAALYRLLTQRARDQEPLDVLVSALNVSETHFHRDRDQIRALAERILPAIILRRRSQRRRRLWSAACSTGEEAYTLAILVCQQLPDQRRLGRAHPGQRRQRRHPGAGPRGRLRPPVLPRVPQNVKHAWFVPEGDRYRVAPQLRAMVRFEQVNLVGDAPAWSPAEPWDYDLILCRNVLLYFDGSTARTVVGRLGACLDDHGWLLLSQVEAGLDLVDTFGIGAGRPRRRDRGRGPAAGRHVLDRGLPGALRGAGAGGRGRPADRHGAGRPAGRRLPAAGDPALLGIYRRQQELAWTEHLVERIESELEAAGVLGRPERVPAVSFLDLVGYTHLTEQQGDATAAALVETLAVLVNRPRVSTGTCP